MSHLSHLFERWDTLKAPSFLALSHLSHVSHLFLTHKEEDMVYP